MSAPVVPCLWPDKTKFRTAALARRQMRFMARRWRGHERAVPMSVYPCCDHWHFGRLPVGAR